MITKILSHFDIPEDALGTVPRLTIIGGGSALVENHRGLDVLGSERVVISSGGGKITLLGEALELASMTSAEVLISGDIRAIELG